MAEKVITDAVIQAVHALADLGWSQDRIAGSTGYSQSTVSRALAMELPEQRPKKLTVLQQWIALEGKQREIRDQIFAEYTANGESDRWRALWAESDALSVEILALTDDFRRSRGEYVGAVREPVSFILREAGESAS